VNRFPIITLGVLALAVIAGLWTDAAPALVYNRHQILSGEVWRIVTCNWVHFSWSHFIYDVLAFALAGSLIELRGHPGFGWVCLLSPTLIGLAVFLTQPDLELFGGLSGLATGSAVFLSLHGLREHNAWRWICWFALAVIAVKIGLEFATGQLAFAQSGALALKPVPASHVAGGLSATLVWLFARVTPCRQIRTNQQDQLGRSNHCDERPHWCVNATELQVPSRRHCRPRVLTQRPGGAICRRGPEWPRRGGLTNLLTCQPGRLQ